MNFRQTAILIGAVFAVVAVMLVLTWTSDDKTPGTDVLTEELAGVKADEVDTVEMERDTGSKLKMVRTDKNRWELVEPYRAPAEGTAVSAVVGALMRAKPVSHPELTSNLAAHALDPPGLKVTLRQGDKASTINLGNVSIGSKGVVFVTTSARPQRPMAVPRSELDPLFREAKGNVKAVDIAKWVADYRVKSVFPADSRAMGEDVTALKLELPNKKKELALSRTAAGGWKFDSPAGWGDADGEGDSAGLPTAFTGVGPLLRALTNVTAGAPADFIEQPKDLKEYGLNPDNPDRIRVEMKTKDGQTAVAYLGKIETGAPPPPSIPGMPPHPPTGGKVFVSVEGQPGVIRANAANLSGLAAIITDPNPLRDRDLLRADRTKVDGIDIVLPGLAPDKLPRLRKVGTDWRLYGDPKDPPQTAFAAPVMKIVDVVTAPRAIKDFPAPNPANFAAIAATLYVWVDGFNPSADPRAEPVKKAEPTKLEFGRVEGDAIYVRRTLPTGQVNEFTLPTSVKVSGGIETLPVLATASKTRLDLLDPSLPTFSDAAVQRIAVSGENNYTLVRDEKPDPVTKELLWRYAEPAPQKGQVADSKKVSEMLTLLATSQGSFGKFVDEKPANLAEYGLAPPRLKVVIGLGGKSESDPGYEFGKDAVDADQVYARVAGRTAVFTMQRRAFDLFRAPDLRDRVVFRAIRPAEVTRLELRGWVGLVGKTQIRVTLEKNKDGVWVVPPAAPGAPANAPDGFVVDSAKVNAFLNLLATAQAKTFESGRPEAKHGIGDQDPFLEIKVYGPHGMTFLNLGASPDGGGSYYAVTNAVPEPNPVITLDAAPFKAYKEKPTALAK